MRSNHDHYPERTKNPDLQCEVDGCSNKKIEGCKRCYAHGANKELQNQDKRALYEFKKREVTERIERFKEADSSSLEVELGLVRMSLEHIVNAIDTPTDWLARQPQISALVAQINGTLQSKIKVEQLTKHLLSEEEVKTIAATLVASVEKYVPDPEVRGKIMTDFQEALNRL